MKENSDPTFIPFPNHHDTDQQAAAGGGARRGRPNNYAPRILDMLCDSVRRFGLSDSAAAEQQGLSTSTLSRWKRLFPEVAIKLKQARAEIRAYHFQRVKDHAETDKGWRASIWILERLFPGDYSPRIKDRLEYLDLQDRLASREQNEALDELMRESREMQEEARAARAAARAAAVAEVPVAATVPQPVPTSAGEERGVESTDVSDGVVPAGHPPVAAHGVRETQIYSEGASHNSRNSGEEAAEVSEVCECQSKEPGRPRPADSNRAAAPSETRSEHSAHEHTGKSAASPSGSSGRGLPSTALRTCGPGSLNEATRLPDSRFYSESASHISRNSGEGVAAVPDEHGCGYEDQRLTHIKTKERTSR